MGDPCPQCGAPSVTLDPEPDGDGAPVAMCPDCGPWEPERPRWTLEQWLAWHLGEHGEEEHARTLEEYDVLPCYCDYGGCRGWQVWPRRATEDAGALLSED